MKYFGLTSSLRVATPLGYTYHSVKSYHIQQKYINNFDFCIVSMIK
jgi:hypothetical protein